LTRFEKSWFREMKDVLTCRLEENEKIDSATM